MGKVRNYGKEKSQGACYFLSTFVEGYRAKGMTQVDGAHIPAAGHYLLADNPESVADLIEWHAGSEACRSHVRASKNGGAATVGDEDE